VKVRILQTEFGKYLLFYDDEKKEAIISSLNGWIYSYSTKPLIGKGYWDKMLALTKIIMPKKVLILGLSGGTLALLIKKYISKNIKIEGVEIDQVLIKEIKPYFSNLNFVDKIIIDDAYEFVEKTKRKYDLVIFDIYLNDRIPPKFKTKEFFDNLTKVLSKEGAALLNIIDTELKEFQRELKKRFKKVRIFKSGKYNFIILATKSQKRVGEKKIEKIIEKFMSKNV